MHMLHLRKTSPGQPYILYVYVKGLRDGNYELRLASHQQESALPFLALDFLTRLTEGCTRLSSATTTSSSVDPHYPKLHLQATLQAGKPGVAVMWRRGVLAHVQGGSSTERALVTAALHAALKQLEDWRAELLTLYHFENPD